MSAELAQFFDDVLDYMRHKEHDVTAGDDEESQRRKLYRLVHRVCLVYIMKYSREKTNLLLNPKKKKIICSN